MKPGIKGTGKFKRERPAQYLKDRTPAEKKKRAARNKARATAIKDGRIKKGSGKDIDHKNPLRSGGSNAKANTRVRSRKANRSDNGGKGGRKKGS